MNWFANKLPRWVAIVLCGLALCCGCQDALDDLAFGPQTTESEAEVVQDAGADFQIAMDYLDNFHQYDPISASERILYHLQRWSSTREPDPDWIAEPLYSRLPERFSRMQGQTTLSRINFQMFDIMMLREAMWMRDLARQIRNNEVRDVELSEWLDGQSEKLGEPAAEDLETAVAIMDWVVRNIQQDPLPSERKTAAADDSQEATEIDGASFLPGEALLLGHGDWIARCRIATLMGRQLGIPITLLAIDDDDADRPWCLSVLVDGRLYLFDMKLGLPIPGAGGEGLATLGELLESPELLEQLKDPGGAQYRITPDDLKNVVALIETTPEYLSQRMKVVEAALPSKRKMVLTCTPSRLKQEFGSVKGITNVRLWTIPYDAYLQRQRMQSTGEAALYLRKIQNELAIVGGPTPLANGRRQHFRGQYASNDDERGAKSYYMNSRVSDESINRELEGQQLAEFLGMPEDQLPKDPQAIKRVLAVTRHGLRTTKRYATYWLGLISYEQGKYEAAANYFGKRLIDADSTGKWTQGARYNLGRTYEQLGRLNNDAELLQKARELYVSDAASPQATGNRIRAEWLGK